MECILKTARQGLHPFFDPLEVRQSLTDSSPLSLEETYESEPLLEQVFVNSQDLHAAHAALEKLEPTQRKRLIRTYFALVENMLFSEGGLRH